MYNNNTCDSLKNLTLKNISRSKKEKGSFPWEIKIKFEKKILKLIN